MERINDTLSAVERNAESIKGTLEKMQVDRSSQSVSSLNVNAGGVGVWIATTACCVMIAVGLLLGLWVVDLSRKVERLEDYLQAIYAQAPYLKPKDSQ
jgi:hypothetical protein